MVFRTPRTFFSAFLAIAIAGVALWQLNAVSADPHEGGDSEGVGYGYEPGRVTICHKPGTPAEKTMTLPEEALRGHMRHGDTMGPCAGGTAVTHEADEPDDDEDANEAHEDQHHDATDDADEQENHHDQGHGHGNLPAVASTNAATNTGNDDEHGRGEHGRQQGNVNGFQVNLPTVTATPTPTATVTATTKRGDDDEDHHEGVGRGRGANATGTTPGRGNGRHHDD